MPGQKHMIRVGVTLNEVAPGPRACLWVNIGGAVPVGTRQLDRVMNRVTCDQGFAATAPNPETRMTRAMPRQWRECEVVIEIPFDAGVGIDEIDEAGLRERQDALAKGRTGREAAFPAAVIVEPVLKVLAIEQVAGVGKSWREVVVSLHHVPADMI